MKNYKNYLFFINLYLFNSKIYLNKILYDKISLLKIINNEKINDFYNNIKKSVLNFNPFYGIKIESFIKKKKKRKKIYSNFFFTIPYKDLTYIFNLSIEKIRIKKKNVKNLFNFEKKNNF